MRPASQDVFRWIGFNEPISHRHLQQLTGVSERTLERAVASLVQDQWIRSHYLRSSQTRRLWTLSTEGQAVFEEMTGVQRPGIHWTMKMIWRSFRWATAQQAGIDEALHSHPPDRGLLEWVSGWPADPLPINRDHVWSIDASGTWVHHHFAFPFWIRASDHDYLPPSRWVVVMGALLERIATLDSPVNLIWIETSNARLEWTLSQLSSAWQSIPILMTYSDAIRHHGWDGVIWRTPGSEHPATMEAVAPVKHPLSALDAGVFFHHPRSKSSS